MFRKMLLTTALAVAVTGLTATTRAKGEEWKLGVRVQVLGSNSGHHIDEVISGSPAEQIGLSAGDVLLSVNGTLVGKPEDVRTTIFASDSVKLLIQRGGEYYETQVDFAPPPQSNGGGSGIYYTTAAKKVNKVTTRKVNTPAAKPTAPTTNPTPASKPTPAAKPLPPVTKPTTVTTPKPLPRPPTRR